MKITNVRYPFMIWLAGIFRREVLIDSMLERERIENASKFKTQFADNIFQNEYAILYELAVMRNLTTGEWPVMAAVIEENRELILNAPQVHLSQFSDEYTDSDQYDSFINITRDAYERICNLSFPGAEGFRTACNSFVETYEKKYGRAVLSVAGGIMNSPEPFLDFRGGRRREYQGYHGAMNFILMEKNRIDALRGAQRVRQFVLDEEWLHGQIDPCLAAEREKRTELLCKLEATTIIEAINLAAERLNMCIGEWNLHHEEFAIVTYFLYMEESHRYVIQRI